MIVKEFKIEEINLNYFVGINQVEFDSDYFFQTQEVIDEKETLDLFFKTISEIQSRYTNSIVQFFKEMYILNQDHIFSACYYLQKAFFNQKNISNKKEIELLLYLSTNRQISKSIQALGIEYSDIRKGNLLYCIISSTNILHKLNNEILKVLKAKEKELTINNASLEKINLIQEFYEISEEQITCILNSYGKDSKCETSHLKSKFSALFDLICERMVLLSIENI